MIRNANAGRSRAERPADVVSKAEDRRCDDKAADQARVLTVVPVVELPAVVVEVSVVTTVLVVLCVLLEAFAL